MKPLRPNRTIEMLESRQCIFYPTNLTNPTNPTSGFGSEALGPRFYTTYISHLQKWAKPEADYCSKIAATQRGECYILIMAIPQLSWVAFTPGI